MMDFPLEFYAPLIAVVAFVAIGGWVLTTWMRIKNGYPLENSWGKPVYPQADNEAKARIQLLTQENAQLRAEIGAIKDRLVNVERIVTDTGYTVSNEIERLRSAPRKTAEGGAN